MIQHGIGHVCVPCGVALHALTIPQKYDGRRSLGERQPRGVSGVARTLWLNCTSHALPWNSLRAILRNMLSSKTPGLVAAFLASTRTRLHHRSGGGAVAELKQPLFSEGGPDAPAPQLLASLARARMLYGSGLGFASLQPLTAVVRSTIGHRWLPEGQIAYALVMADADIAQGLQVGLRLRYARVPVN